MYKQLSDNIRYIKGVGPARAGIFQKLGVENVEDLFYYFPRRYEDRTNITEISHLKPGEFQTVKGKVLGLGQRLSYHKKGLKIFEIIVEDKSARLHCVWFNQPYLRNYLKANKEVLLYGKVDFRGRGFQMQNPEFEIIDGQLNADNLNYGRIAPVYSASEKLSQRIFRKVVKSALGGYLSQTTDIIPFDMRRRHNLLNIAEAISNMHFPSDALHQDTAFKRIVFEECFLLQLIFGLRRKILNMAVGIAHKPDEFTLSQFIKGLAFELTDAQKRVIGEIKQDMVSKKPMHRLLQGDVGSGKTVVALYACLIAVSAGYQAAFMAPTEILAEQHYKNITGQLSGLKKNGAQIRTALLIGSLNAKEKENIFQQIRNGGMDIVIGTHSLIQQQVEFKNLGLAVIDEQHKFGVYQRLNMQSKGINPDCLIMTATPIPRTLAMTIYSDMDISTLNQMPKGRLEVKTYVLTEEKRQWVYDFIKDNLENSRQCFMVYPIIDESEKLDLKAAKSMFEDLSKNVFKDYKLGLVHGRLKQKQRDLVMQKFKEGKIDMLVSTVVIEVGIDIPNATVMVIEHAERFGLAQLHQLRGRIGRGSYQSHCILLAESSSEESSLRLKAIAEESDGFKIAERDLEIRGPGEFFGRRQHGIPELRVNVLSDIQTIKIAKDEASGLLDSDPALSLRQNQGLVNTLKKRFPEYEKLITA